ncbi:MAG TPA: hypothetical protein VHD56_05340 [Tepidisphaeraceae bacterium]|nr:hypothetical protein [Tepidisphaeraceae bacterium]
MFDDREASPDEVAAFVNGGNVGTSRDHQAPVVDEHDDQWAAPVEVSLHFSL